MHSTSVLFSLPHQSPMHYRHWLCRYNFSSFLVHFPQTEPGLSDLTGLLIFTLDVLSLLPEYILYISVSKMPSNSFAAIFISLVSSSILLIPKFWPLRWVVHFSPGCRVFRLFHVDCAMQPFLISLYGGIVNAFSQVKRIFIMIEDLVNVSG